MEFSYVTVMSGDKKYIVWGAGINNRELLFPTTETRVAVAAPREVPGESSVSCNHCVT